MSYTQCPLCGFYDGLLVSPIITITPEDLPRINKPITVGMHKFDLICTSCFQTALRIAARKLEQLD